MKNKKHKYLILIPIGILFTLSFLFFSFKNVSAVTLLEQNISNSNVYFNGQNLGQRLGTGLEIGVINSGNIFLNATSTNQNGFTVTFEQCAGGTYNDSLVCSGSASSLTTFIASTSVPDNFSGYFNFTFPSATTTNNSSDYALYILPDYTVGNEITSLGGSININSYSNGQCGRVLVGECNNFGDLFFQLGSNIATTTGNTLNFNFPTYNFYSLDFGSFNVNYEILSTSTPLANFFLQVIYGTLTSTSSNGTGIISYSSTNTPILKTTFLPSGDYYATSNLIAVTNPTNSSLGFAYILVSTTTRFSIGGNGSTTPYWTPPNNTFGNILFDSFASTTGNIFDQCNQLNVNAWQTFVCNLLSFLFRPHQSSLNAIRNVLTSFQNVFPFSIVYGLQQNTISFLETGTSTAPFALSFRTPAGSFNATVLTATSFLDNVPAFRNLYFIFVEAFIWIGLGVLIYKHIV